MYEEKLNLIRSYIDRCDECIKGKDHYDADRLADDFVAVFRGEVKDAGYGIHTNGPSDWNRDENSIKRIRQKLENYATSLKLQAEDKEYELKIAEANSTSITNSNSLNNNVNITLSQVYDAVNNSKSLSEEDLQKLKELLGQISIAEANKDKKTVKEKVAAVLRFIADKGVDALIAAGPYLIQALK